MDDATVVEAGAGFGARGVVSLPGVAVCGDVPDALEALMGLVV